MTVASRQPAHRVTTANLGAAYPFMAEGSLGTRGVLIGRDLFGGAFVYDPWELYPHVITSPNMIISGQLGSGKSALVKSYLARQRVFGRKACILDAKPHEGQGEYARLCQALGVRPIALRPGGSVKLNPLDARMARSREPHEVFLDQLRILQAVVGAALDRDLGPEEETACRLALQEVLRHSDAQPVLPQVVEAMLRPQPEAAAAAAVDLYQLRSMSYRAALALGNLCEGELSGMFDSATTEGIDLSMPLLDLDLSGLHEVGERALGIVMVCLQAWLRRAMAADSANWLVVNEEAWYVLANLATARWLQWSYKMARALGVQNIAVIHRLTDLEAVGGRDSQQAKLALGLLSDSETLVIYRQPTAELRLARELLHLTDAESSLIPHLRRGTALWRVGQRRFLVEHLLSDAERWIVDTDTRMSGAA